MNIKEQKINRSLIFGWMLIVSILLVTYAGEFIKGERTLGYLIAFSLITVIPAMIALCIYLKNQDNGKLRYIIVIGYSIMYVFVMMTGSTTMVFSYILPLLSFLILYHQPSLILWSGIVAMFFNLLSIFIRFMNGQINTNNSKDVEIQIALIFLCFFGSYLATKLYDDITKENNEYMKVVEDKNNQIQKMTLQTITTIANTIDAKDQYTRGHSKRVSEYSAAIATEMGMDYEEVENIRSIALLHDIGKIGIPDSILSKPGKLTDAEYKIMKSHTTIGGEILKDIGMLPGIDIGAKYHHERYDGKGYPEGLKGDDIPYIARIIGVADAYDAMSSTRVYRRHLSEKKILSEIENNKGKQFDPEAADAILKLIHKGAFTEIQKNIEGTVSDDEMSKLLGRIIEQREKQLGEGLRYDDLTGFYDRDTGEKMIAEEMKINSGCLILLDMDDFRAFNDEYGYVSGDLCLKVFADEIKTISDGFSACRSSGDEFVLFVKDIDDDGFDTMIRQLYDKVAKAFNDVSIMRNNTFSTGAVICQKGDKYEEKIKLADKALYVSQQKGGACYNLYDARNPLVEKRNISGKDLNRLVEILQTDNSYKGAFNVKFPEFAKILEYVRKVVEREKGTYQVILFTLEPESESKISLEQREHVMGILEQAILMTIRGVDVSTKYSSLQRLVILMNTPKENISIVTDRIIKEYYKMYTKKDFMIHVDVADIKRV